MIFINLRLIGGGWSGRRRYRVGCDFRKGEARRCSFRLPEREGNPRCRIVACLIGSIDSSLLLQNIGSFHWAHYEIFGRRAMEEIPQFLSARTPTDARRGISLNEIAPSGWQTRPREYVSDAPTDENEWKRAIERIAVRPAVHVGWRHPTRCSQVLMSAI